MSQEVEFLKRMIPSDPDRAVEAAERFLRTHGRWAATVPARQWEALRRLAPEAAEYGQLSAGFDTFLKEAGERADSGEKWGDSAAVGALKQAFREASQPDGSAAAEFYTERRDQQPVRSRPRIDGCVRLQLGRRFLDTLVMAVLAQIWRFENGPEAAAEEWFAVHWEWAASIREGDWGILLRAISRAARLTPHGTSIPQSIVKVAGSIGAANNGTALDSMAELLILLLEGQDDQERRDRIGRLIIKLDALRECTAPEVA